MFKSVNKKLCCTPFQDMSVKKTVMQTKSGIGVGMIESQKALTSLEILFENEMGLKGKVWLKSDLFVHPWAKEIHEFEGVKFILVPYEMVSILEND